MKTSTLFYAFSRPWALIPTFAGFALSIREGPGTMATILFIIGITNALRIIANSPNLDRLLKLAEEKRRMGISWKLSELERREMAFIDQYAQNLLQQGAAAQLVDEVRARAWEIIIEAGPNNAATYLKTFRKNLPRITRTQSDSSLHLKVKRELELLSATQTEINSL